MAAERNMRMRPPNIGHVCHPPRHRDLDVNYLLDYPGFRLREHGLVDGGGPYPYFSGNGGPLYAVAMITVDWNDSKGTRPGFPKDSSLGGEI